MSVFTPIKSNVTNKVHYSDYIRTENKPDESGTKPAETETPAAPEAK